MQLFTNNASTRLVAGISNVSLSLQVAAGDGMKFPVLTGADYFLATLYKSASGVESAVEIIKVTGRNADVFTMVRAQEGTAAQVYAESDFLQLRLTASTATFAEGHFNNLTNPHSVTKVQVGLGNADNTADASKPVSTAQAAALGLKANSASPAFTGTVTGLTAAMVGLGSVDNTADSAKPVSTAQAAALGLKANLASPGFTGTVTGISAAMVGLGSVDNTSDVNKPVSTAQAAADATKQATLVSGTSIKTVGGVSLLGSGDIPVGVGDVTLAGVQTLTNKTITETVFALTGTAPALSATNGAVQTWTLTAASAPTSSLAAGQSIILQITPGAFALTWPAGTVFTKVGGSGVAPALFSAGKTTVVLWRVGSVLYISHLGDTA